METTVRAPRPEKVAVVNEVRDRLSAADAAILTEYRGLAVKDMKELRRSLTAVGGDYKVYKNTLVRRAAQEIGFTALESMLTGPTAIAFVDGDVAQVAKVLRDFSRTNPNLVVKGGVLGSNLLDAASTSALADLPSRDVLLAQIAGMLAAPMQQFAALLKAVPSKFAYALSALIDERRSTEPEPVATEPEVAEPVAIEEPAPVETEAESSDAAATDAPAGVDGEPVAVLEETEVGVATTDDASEAGVAGEPVAVLEETIVEAIAASDEPTEAVAEPEVTESETPATESSATESDE